MKNDILQWDIRSWEKALKYWENNMEWDKVSNALELGSNKGGLSLWLGLKGVNVVCTDLTGVESNAKPLHDRYDVSGKISYQDIDASDLPYESEFDVIIFKSIIGGIGRNDDIDKQRKVFKEIHKALKPGGKLLFAENLIASPMHKTLRKNFVNWGDSWRYVSLDEMNDFLQIFDDYSIKTTGVISTFGRNEKQRNLFSTADRLLLNHISPRKWKYICYGIATK
ncbi:MAG: methyltransferase domain-containing protein [Brumimicrobium sp.]|nr:methyltransferase domain-containing protein [Brumimicrobium sp.]